MEHRADEMLLRSDEIQYRLVEDERYPSEMEHKLLPCVLSVL
jgi:hypothetical protein